MSVQRRRGYSFAAAWPLRYFLVGAVVVMCLVLRLLTSSRTADVPGASDSARVAIRVADDLVSWMGGTAIGVLIGLLVLDRWKASQEREKDRQEERLHSQLISKQVRLTLADMRHGLKLLTVAMVETDNEVLEDCFLGTYEDILGVEDPPSDTGIVQASLGCAATRADRIYREFGHGAAMPTAGQSHGDDGLPVAEIARRGTSRVTRPERSESNR